MRARYSIESVRKNAADNPGEVSQHICVSVRDCYENKNLKGTGWNIQK